MTRLRPDLALVLAAILLSTVTACDVLTSAPDPPAVPTGVQAAAMATSEIELSWSGGMEAAERVEIERARDSEEFSPLTSVQASTTSHRDTGLDPSTTYRYRIRACNEGGCSPFSGPTQARTLAVLQVATDTLPAGVKDQTYEVTLEASGGDESYTWRGVQGLPSGLSVSESGVLSGTPEQTGEFQVSLEVSSGDGQTATADLTLGVFPPLRVTTTSLPDATVGESYSQDLAASGGDEEYTWDLVQGALPSGLTLSTLGVVSGTPDTGGTEQFTVRVASGDGQTATADLSLTVQSSGDTTAVVIETALLPPGLVGGSYAVPLEASGGDGMSYAWAVTAGSLPAGLTLQSTGSIEGTPTAAESRDVTLEVTSAGRTDTTTFTVRTVVDDTDGYNLTTVDVAGVPSSIQTHLDAAIDRWETVITGDLPSVSMSSNFFGSSHCGGLGELVNGTSVDDQLILINIDSIDGQGQILGQAGPCAVRTTGELPFVAFVTLDEDDLEPLVGTSTLTDLIFHEIGHTVGFGTLWPRFDLVAGSGTQTPLYTGSEGVARYDSVGGSGDVPLENDGGSGTAESHWEEDVFDTEVMTGFSEKKDVAQPLSEVTIGSILDLGYAVNFGAADGFSLSPPRGVAARAGEESFGYDVIYRGPVLVHPGTESGRAPGGGRR